MLIQRVVYLSSKHVHTPSYTLTRTLSPISFVNSTHASAAIALADKVAQNVVALDLDNVDPADMTKFVVSAPYMYVGRGT